MPSSIRARTTSRQCHWCQEPVIDGVKILKGEIPEYHPGAKHGRIGLWTFWSMCEFGNVKVTRLVAAPRKE